MRKFDDSTYKKYGLYITQVNNGYKVIQGKYLYLTLYDSKQKAMNWIDNTIKLLENIERKRFTK